MKLRTFATMLLCLFVLPCISYAASIRLSEESNYFSLSMQEELYKADDIEKRWIHDHWTPGQYWSPDHHLILWLKEHGPRNHCPPKPNPTPIPSAAWLFGTGLVGLYGIRRRMNK